MNIIELEAGEFIEDLYHAESPNTLENLTRRISNKIDVFSREKDQLEFLRLLLSYSERDRKKHEKECTKERKDCSISTGMEKGEFAIKQSISEIESYYVFEPEEKNKFSHEQESDLNRKINQIIIELKNQKLGQEIIFDELIELKEHFNLGRKNWFQLLKGKLFDLSIDHALEKVLISKIFSSLSDGYEEIQKSLNLTSL